RRTCPHVRALLAAAKLLRACPESPPSTSGARGKALDEAVVSLTQLKGEVCQAPERPPPAPPDCAEAMKVAQRLSACRRDGCKGPEREADERRLGNLVATCLLAAERAKRVDSKERQCARRLMEALVEAPELQGRSGAELSAAGAVKTVTEHA